MPTPEYCWSIWAMLFAAVVATSGTLVAAGEASDVTLSRGGEALARIVVSEGARPGAVTFAAYELQEYLSRVSGAAFEVTSNVPEASPRIFLGNCERARAKGLDVTVLKRDGFYRAVIDGDLYILGRDDPDPKWHRGGNEELFNKENGTLNGVYDLLEDVCGVRWFMAGKLGEVVPRRDALTVPDGLIKEEPVFADRRFNQIDIHFYRYPDAKDICENDKERRLWALRLRWASKYSVYGSHSVTSLKFAERFGKAHPDWFALKPDGTRAIKTGYGPHLCWSHPEVVKTFTADAHAYFTHQAPQSRGIDRWRAGYGDMFMVDPSDSYTKCRCERCQETLRAYPGQDYSEIMFNVVAKVAESVKGLEGKYITTLAYPPKHLPPKSVKLPANVRIRLCISGSNAAMRPLANESQMKLMKEWSARMDGDLVLWTYPLVSWYKGHLNGAVETMPHAISDFLNAARPYISGVMYQNNAVTETYRALDSYIMMRLAWDPGQDVDALLEDYFSKFYGPAGDVIQALYGQLEEDWKRILTFYSEAPSANNRWLPGPYGTASRVDLWEQVYTEEELGRFHAWLKKAEEQTADQPEYAARVALLRKHLYGRLVSGRQGFQDTLGQASIAKTVCHLSPLPPDADGFLSAEAWKDADWNRMQSVSSRHDLNVMGRFKTLWREGNFYLLADLEEPEIDKSRTARRRKQDDPHIWKDNDLEILFGLRDEINTAYHILINDRGVFSDNKNLAGGLIWDWSSGANVRVHRAATGWTVQMALCLQDIGIPDPTAAEAFGFNVVRHRAIKGQEGELYGWSRHAYPGAWTDASLFGSIRFVNKKPRRLGEELVINGSFEESGAGDQPFAGWTVYHYPEGKASVRGAGSTSHRDEVTRWDGRASLRYEGGNATLPFYTVSTYQYPRGLKPDTRYRFRCRVKTQDVKVKTSGLYGAYVNFYVPVVHRFDPNPGLTGSGDWRTIEYTVRTAKAFGDNAKCYFILAFHEATGKAWFDEVSLREVF